jgi:carboxypeptidase C (cathepsin A)
MKLGSAIVAFAAFALLLPSAFAKDGAKDRGDKSAANDIKQAPKITYFQPEESVSHGSVTVGGNSVDYDAIAGTLVVHPKGWDDAPQTKAEQEETAESESNGDEKDNKNPSAEASMFYVAYFKHDAKGPRPITFLYNGGPGSSTVWLHMGAFGPRRVVTSDDSHTPPAPYAIINNGQSLLDVTDLVFIDAPGTGFSRISGPDKEKMFYGVDPDAHAFAEFINKFLSKYGRWNSPKYLFGESYGTTRSAVLVNLLEQEYDTDFNGVILLSQILNFDLSPDGPLDNPGVNIPYQLALPSYAATAWYHHKLPGNPPDLEALVSDVEHFAMGDYAHALGEGAALSDAERDAVAEKLHQYTGLSVAYIKKANLRIDGGMFEQNLEGDTDTATGRLDSRFSGPTMDPLSKETDYDPQGAAISSAYVSAFNDYVRRDLHFGRDKQFKPEIELWKNWDNKHVLPGSEEPSQGAANVMPDLAAAMKYNPDLKVQLNAGYFDLGTPFFEGQYEMRHLDIPAKLQDNIQFRLYKSGHMVYAHQDSLRELHDNVAAFIRETDNLPAK